MKKGLSLVILDELGKQLQEFEDTFDKGAAGKAGHVGAGADLTAVAAELVEVVELLNTFNRHRFRNDPELAAAWDTARTVIGPAVRKRAQPEGGSPQQEAAG